MCAKKIEEPIETISLDGTMNKAMLIPVLKEEVFMTKNFKALLETINKLQEAGLPVLLKGEAGAGKNYAVWCLAAKMGKPVIRINCSGDLRSSSLLGRMILKEDGSSQFQPGLITLAVETGCWLVIDEINSLEPEILFSIHGLLDEGKLSVANNSQIIVAHPDFRFFATMNQGYIATKPLNQALLDRLPTVSVDYDQEIDEQYMKQLPIKATDRPALFNVILKIRKAAKERTVSQTFGHRTLSTVVKLCKSFDLQTAFNIAYTNKLDSLDRVSAETILRDLTNIETVRKS